MVINISRSTVVMLLILPVAIGFVGKIVDVHDYAFLQYYDEIILLMLSPLALKGLFRILKYNFGIVAISCFGGYICASLAGALINDVGNIPVLYQLAIELKPLVILLVVMGCSSAEPNIRLIGNFGKVTLLLCIPIIGWQLFDPNTYDVIFSSSAHSGVFILPGEVALPRSVGIFWHPGSLAVFSGIYSMFFLFRYTETKRFNYIKWFILAVVLLLLSLSRLEILSVLIAVTFVIIINRRGPKKYFCVLTVVLTTLFLLLVAQPYIEFVVEKMSLNNLGDSVNPRVVFATRSVAVANDLFPLGGGLGNYGGFAASIFDSELYYQYGMDQYSWFDLGLYKVDTFWPHILGEAGYLGLLFFILFLIVLFRQLLLFHKQIMRSGGNLFTSKMAISAFIFLVLNSFASPNFYSTVDVYLTFVFFSMMVHNQVHAKLKASNGEYRVIK
jgi:hypothetical protein